ncbi:hypothetical protein KKE13_00830 [Patescibacteria group bacterium]|nr:hypothetical protein [Patescibacteria group bacterium]
MDKIKKTIFLTFILLGVLFITPVQGQDPKAEVILTWSTDTYVPLNYSGKVLPSPGSIIEVVADIIPKSINPQELNYRWFLNRNLEKNASGLGKETFKFTSDEIVGGIYSIRLEVINQAGLIIASASQEIKTIEPEIFLETKALLLDSSKYLVLANQETVFKIQPYFFNVKTLAELNYQWILNGIKASQISKNNPNIFTIKTGQLTQMIEQELKISVESDKNIFQKAQTTAELIFRP